MKRKLVHDIKTWLRIRGQRIRRSLTFVDAIGSGDTVQYFGIQPPAFDVSALRKEPQIAAFSRPKKDAYIGVTPYAVKASGWYYDTRFNILLDGKRRIIGESVNASVIPVNYTRIDRKRPEEARIKGPATVFRTQSSELYHLMVDNLPRLYLLGKVASASPIPIKLLIPEPIGPLEQRWIGTLLPDNVEVHLLNRQQTMVRIDDMLYLSPFTRRFAGALPLEYVRHFRGLACEYLPASARERRIFISRIATTKGSSRCICNEEQLLARLAPLGFERHVLEHLDVDGQVELFRSAKFIVAAHGAGLSNLVFSENASVIELFPGPYMIPHFFFLSKSLGLRYSCHFSNQPGRNDNFHVDVNAVEQLVKKQLSASV